MKIGAAMFFTDYSMSPGELAVALEERGFDSLWAPEHSHIPLARTASYPGGGALPREYYEVMDPFVTLTAAAAATKPRYCCNASSRSATPRGATSSMAQSLASPLTSATACSRWPKCAMPCSPAPAAARAARH